MGIIKNGGFAFALAMGFVAFSGEVSASTTELSAEPGSSGEGGGDGVRKRRRLETFTVETSASRDRQRLRMDEVLTEEHDLFELIARDPEQNLVYKAPSIAMTAAQKIASWIVKSGVSEIQDPEFGNGKINYYPLFSGGIPEAGGKMIIGQFEAIQNFVSYVFAAARGDGSANKLLLFVGPSGTGKSAFLKILQTVAEKMSANSPDHYIYTYEWKNLSQFQTLIPALNIQEHDDGTKFEFPYPCPINESPFNLIPEELGDQVYDLVSGRIKALTQFPAKKTTSIFSSSGVRNEGAKPKHYHCPQCFYIRETILSKFMRDHNLTSLSPLEEVEALAPYVNIKRMVVGRNGSMAVVDAEAKDVNYQELFTSPNIFVFPFFGQSHPMSYNYNGKILRANGTMGILDEFFRNAKDLRDASLGLIEEKKVTRGGAPEVELDMLLVGASNKESIDEVMAGNGAKAHLDRTNRVRMPYLINPYLEAKNLLNMKNMRTVLMQKLGSSEDASGTKLSPQEQGNINTLFPLPMFGEAPIGPDGRYKLWFTEPSGEQVHLSPHALMYIAMTVAGSRLVVKPELALKFGEKGVINDAAFRDRFTRLQVLMKQYRGLNATALMELRSLSRDLEEGDQGISERDAANVWLTSAIEEAKQSTNGNCVTPMLAKKVLLRLMEAGSIGYPSHAVAVEWKTILEEMETKYVIPNIQQDVSAALGSGSGKIKSMYNEIMQELDALALNADATQYLAANGEFRTIDRERLNEVRKIFAETEHRMFNFNEVSIIRLTGTGTNPLASDREGASRHPGLFRAVTKYVAKRETEMVTFDDIQRFSEMGEGSSDVRQRAGAVGSVLTHELGYCGHCSRTALMAARKTASQMEQAKQSTR